MHFDDRLATVLRQSVTGEAAARIQYRQLLDLLGAGPVEARNGAIDAAGLRLGELAGSIASPERARMIRDPGVRLRNPALIAALALGEPQTAAAAIEAAQLDEEQWLDLAPALPVAARAFLRQRRDLGGRVEALLTRLGIHDRGLPPADAAAARPTAPRRRAAPELAAGTAAEPPADLPVEPLGIGAIVKRIEDFRKARQPIEAEFTATDSPLLPLGDTARNAVRLPILAFDFATDAEGRIVWCSRDAAPMAAGLRLDSLCSEGPAATPADSATVGAGRLPIRARLVELEGAPAIAGRWQIDASPCFDGSGSRFTGYAGRMRRIAAPAAESQPVPAGREADRMRQLLHELRTPVNAIQGFAEVIQQQIFGPAPHGYRALAAAIAADAATILAAFEELDRLARLEGGQLELDAGQCDLAPVLEAAIGQLAHFTESRGSGFAARIEGHCEVAMTGGDAERLVWRLLATLAGAASPGEVLALLAHPSAASVEIEMQLPASLASLGTADLFGAIAAPGHKAVSAGAFGSGFSLRLAAAEAAAAGGSLEHRGQALSLRLPGLTAMAAAHSK